MSKKLFEHKVNDVIVEVYPEDINGMSRNAEPLTFIDKGNNRISVQTLFRTEVNDDTIDVHVSDRKNLDFSYFSSIQKSEFFDDLGNSLDDGLFYWEIPSIVDAMEIVRGYWGVDQAKNGYVSYDLTNTEDETYDALIVAFINGEIADAFSSVNAVKGRMNFYDTYKNVPLSTQKNVIIGIRTNKYQIFIGAPGEAFNMNDGCHLDLTNENVKNMIAEPGISVLQDEMWKIYNEVLNGEKHVDDVLKSYFEKKDAEKSRKNIIDFSGMVL